MLATPEYYTVDNEAGGKVKVGPSGQAPRLQVWPLRLMTQVFYCYYVPLVQGNGAVSALFPLSVLYHRFSPALI